MQTRPVDIVPDDQKVIGEPHLDDDAQLVFDALFDRIGDIFVAFGKPLPRQPRKIIGRGGTVVGGVERDKRGIPDGRPVGFEVENRLLYFIGDHAGIGNRLGHIIEQLRHLVARLHIKFVRFKLHALGIGKRFFRLNTQQDILRLPVLFIDIVNVVGCDKLNVQLPRDLNQLRNYLLFFGDIVILDFDVKILPEHLFHFPRPFLCAVVIAVHQQLRHSSRKAGGKADHSFVVLFQQLIVDPRLAVKSVDIRKRIQLDDIFIPRLVFGKHDNMLRLGTRPLVEIIVRGVKLAADDIFDSFFDALLRKIEGGVHIAVIGYGTAVYVVFYEIIDEVVHFGGSVEKAVFGMQM